MSAVNQQFLDEFVGYLVAERKNSEHTVQGYATDLALFLQFLGETALIQANREHIQRFLADETTRGIGARTRARRLSALRSAFRYLHRRGRINVNPTEHLEAPFVGKRLPKVLSEAHVTDFLNAPDVSKPFGLRDAAMLELLYSCGLRVSELVSLRFTELRLDREILLIFGKGGKQRLIPFGRSARERLTTYLVEGRPALVKGSSDDVFLNRFGRAMTRQAFWQMVKKYALVAGIDADKLTPHVLRHCFATHLLNHGADLRAVQALLGHRDLKTTEIYTEVARERLRAVHADCHPLEQG
nr:site-specific tyrosine recombinase XerD [Acanthopleuribacter pedis]